MSRFVFLALVALALFATASAQLNCEQAVAQPGVCILFSVLRVCMCVFVPVLVGVGRTLSRLVVFL